ncbi:MAG: MotA/TolQ/ExbB proton channel family protein [Planctomycetaceae bacterium]
MDDLKPTECVDRPATRLRRRFDRNSASQSRLRTYAVLGLVCLLLMTWTWVRAQDGEKAAPVDPFPVTTESAGSAPVAPAAAPVKSTLKTIPSDFVGIMLALDWFLPPFIICSVVAVWFVIERMVVLRVNRVIPNAFVDRFLQLLEQQKLDAETALKLCEQNDSPVASVFAHGIRKWGKPSVEVEQAIIDGGERQISHLRKHLRIINGVATVAPLFGLLGTVVGMIESFNQIAVGQAAGKAEQLAAGIALALLTTAVGLLIAIPCLVIYMYLVGRVDNLVMLMDDLAQKVVNLISAESLSARAAANATVVRRRKAPTTNPATAAEPQEST